MEKNNFEGTINFYSDEPHVFLPTAFKSIEKEYYSNFYNHNIYLIAHVNRLWFHPNMVELNLKECTFKIHIVIQNGYDRIIYPIISNIPIDTEFIEVSNFPHREIYLKNSNNEIISCINAMQLMIDLPEDIKPEFEVLYVGKSYGYKRRINILDRLFKQHHKKFKDILIDTIEDCPDKQIVVFALNFIFDKKFIFSVFNQKNDTNFEKDQNRINYLKDIDINRKYKIDLIEEALINYFSPKYNGLLKESLNKLSSKSIRAFQKLDLSKIVVEFNTNSTGIKLKSDFVPSKKLHMVQFSIFKNQENILDMENIIKSRKRNIDHLLNLI